MDEVNSELFFNNPNARESRGYCKSFTLCDHAALTTLTPCQHVMTTGGIKKSLNPYECSLLQKPSSHKEQESIKTTFMEDKRLKRGSLSRKCLSSTFDHSAPPYAEPPW